jgi:hypothetical protein
VERTKIRATYNEAQRLAERRTMKQGRPFDELRGALVAGRRPEPLNRKSNTSSSKHENAEFLPIDGLGGAGGMV